MRIDLLLRDEGAGILPDFLSDSVVMPEDLYEGLKLHVINALGFTRMVYEHLPGL